MAQSNPASALANIYRTPELWQKIVFTFICLLMYRAGAHVTAPGVDQSLLDPRSTWADPDAYDRKARELARMFAENFAEKHADAPAEIAAAAPKP